jgi:hypothetical protein
LAVAPAPAGQGYVVSRLTFFDLQNYTFCLAGGSSIDLNPAGDGFSISRANGNSGGFSLAVDGGSHRLTDTGDQVSLPFQGGQAGCLLFDLTLNRAASGPTQAAGAAGCDLARLGAGLRLFYRDTSFQGAAFGAGSSFFISSLHYPVFGEDAFAMAHYSAPLTLYPSLDPLHPLAPERSHFAFVHPVSGAKTIQIPSGYRTNLGYTIHLTPHNRSSRLIFTPRPEDTRTDRPSPLYLAPAGDFEMTVPRYNGNATAAANADNLICGLSGVEYIKLVPNQTNLLCFRPGQTAFLPGFRPVGPLTRRLLELIEERRDPPGQSLHLDAELEAGLGISNVERMEIFEQLRREFFPVNYQIGPAKRNELIVLRRLGDMVTWFQQALLASSGKTQADGPALTDLATTPWVYVRQVGDGSPIYYAQPDQAILYSASPLPDDNDDPTDELLQYMEVPATGLPNLDNGVLAAFPLFPYGGIQASLADYRQLEMQVLNPLRRSRIAEIGQKQAVPLVAGGGEQTVTGTTPQGLLATYSGDYETLKTLLLAKDMAGQTLSLSEIERQSPLRAALQSNQLFMVISNPAALKRYFQNNRLTVQGWTFDLNPDQWRSDTVLIFKFFDKPLIELVEDTHTWSMADELNARKADTRLYLSNLFQEVLLKDAEGTTPKDRRNYGALARAIRTEGWSGIIALNVKVPPSNLPDELKALSAGIEASRFYARYVGIETTPVTPQNGQLVAGLSSLFGLIDYQDDSAPLPTEAGYNFQVTSLKVLFQNSQVKDFSSEVAVTLDRLFDEPTRLRQSDTGRNIILLKGTAENHDGRSTYAFSFSGNNHFDLPDSAVLHEVEIIKAQFSTDPGVAGQAGAITGRFAFWGRLNFKRQEKFDLFSFGAEDAAEGENDKFLSFSNLLVTMTFRPDKPDERTFAFDPRSLAFDTPRSRVRAESLYAKFPLKLTGLIYSKGEKTTDDYGYMPVKSPLSAGKLAKTWYGLTFDLELGNLGALAGQAGLVVSLIAAWSPSLQAAETETDEPEGGGMAVGLRLPGSTGGKREISLQGVLKLAFKSIEFVAGQTADNRASYLLKLKNITLKFLVLSIPPNARSEIIIFGNPDGATEDRMVGWYAAYAKEPSQPSLPGG